MDQKSYAELSKDEKIEALEAALIDVLDGSSDLYEIQANTGCSADRCEEISILFDEVLKEYTLRHKIEG